LDGLLHFTEGGTAQEDLVRRKNGSSHLSRCEATQTKPFSLHLLRALFPPGLKEGAETLERFSLTMAKEKFPPHLRVIYQFNVYLGLPTSNGTGIVPSQTLPSPEGKRIV
jgi:hypothetical protein